MITRLLYALLLVALAGQNQPASAAFTGAVTPPKTQSQTPPKTPADAQIERAIRLKLAKSKLNADHFTVSVSKGVVTIEGSTNVMQHKGVMTRMAKSCGAAAVHNNIRVSDAAKAKAAATLSKNKGTNAPRPIARSSTGGTATAPAAIPRATVLPATSPR